MYLLAATALSLFCFFQMNQLMRGPVGVAFAVSMAVLGAIGILHWAYESTRNKSEGFLSSAAMQAQLSQFMGLPILVKVALLVGSLGLPLTVNALFVS